MDNELGAMLQSVLSDPEQMAKISEMAQGLMGGAASSAETPPAPPAPAGDAKVLSELGALFGGKTETSRSTALLMAMRPYMKPEKQEKLDRAMKLSKMVRIAHAVMGQMGGGHGI